MKNTLKTTLRIRFLLLTMASLLLVQVVIVGISIYHNHRDLLTKSDMLIYQLHQNPDGASRYFSVKIPAGKDTVYPDAVQHVSLTTEEVVSFAHRALAENNDKGFLDGYRYHVYRNEGGTRIYFLFRESAIETCKNAAKNMILVSLVAWVAIGALLIPVSAWVVKPLVDNHNKQKRFITAAAHELKTPLTVIGTSAQLLESEIGQSEWLQSIQKQVEHLTKMTNDLVTLSKSEEYDNPLLRESFSLSETLREVMETYAVIAEQNGIRIEYTKDQEIPYLGSKTEVQQLLGILLDNACKYCPAGGLIRVSTKHIHHGVKILVSNTAELSGGNRGKVPIGRFQRGENAVGKSGFGLGLSIAEAITGRHGGHITAFTTQTGEFLVEVTLH